MEIKTGKMNKEKGQRLTSGFTQAGVYSRRQFCANLEVYRPPEPLWNLRLREAATTLCVIAGLTLNLVIISELRVKLAMTVSHSELQKYFFGVDSSLKTKN